MQSNLKSDPKSIESFCKYFCRRLIISLTYKRWFDSVKNGEIKDFKVIRDFIRQSADYFNDTGRGYIFDEDLDQLTRNFMQNIR